jgi:hypothetical protein
MAAFSKRSSPLHGGIYATIPPFPLWLPATHCNWQAEPAGLSQEPDLLLIIII